MNRPLTLVESIREALGLESAAMPLVRAERRLMRLGPQGPALDPRRTLEARVDELILEQLLTGGPGSPTTSGGPSP